MQFVKQGQFSWAILLLEMASIVFGVLLALAVNEWRQDRIEQKQVETALAGIKAELEKNHQFLEQRIPYYTSMADTIAFLLKIHDNDASFKNVKIPGYRGINPPLLQDAAFETTKNSPAFANMDFEVANTIAVLYSFQEKYGKWVDIYMNAFITSEKQSLSRLYSTFREMSTVGQELMTFQKQIIDRLKKMLNEE